MNQLILNQVGRLVNIKGTEVLGRYLDYYINPAECKIKIYFWTTCKDEREIRIDIDNIKYILKSISDLIVNDQAATDRADFDNKIAAIFK